MWCITLQRSCSKHLCKQVPTNTSNTATFRVWSPILTLCSVFDVSSAIWLFSCSRQLLTSLEWCSALGWKEQDELETVETLLWAVGIYWLQQLRRINKSQDTDWWWGRFNTVLLLLLIGSEGDGLPRCDRCTFNMQRWLLTAVNTLYI